MENTHSKLILACIDGSELGQSVADYSAWVSQTTQTPLKLLHMIEHSYTSKHQSHVGNLTPNMTEDLMEELSEEETQESKRLIQEGKEILSQSKQRAIESGAINPIARQRHGSLSEALAVLESEISVVVIGLSGEDHENHKQGLGSQLEASIRALHKPVFIVRDHFTTPKTVLLAYNGSPASKKALEMVENGALCNKLLQVHVVSVHKDLSEAQRLASEAESRLKQSGVEVKSQALTGDRVEELMSYQNEHKLDLMVMGAFSHGKVHGFLFGSFTSEMLVKLNTPVLLLR